MGQRIVEPQEAIREPINFDARLGWILGAIDAGITVQDARLRLVFANQIAADLCGWSSPEEMVAATGSETLERFEMIDESGGRLDPSRLPGRRALIGEHPDPLVVGFRNLRTGALSWSLVRARLVESGPEGERLVVTTFHDMTAQVEAGQASLAGERRYREIVEALPVVAWLSNPDGTLAAANGRWHAYTGMIAAVGPFPAPDQVHPDDTAGLDAAWTVARATEEALDSTVRLRRHDGTYRWHVVRVVPLCREADTIEGWIGTATDIDEERATRQRDADLARLVADAALRLDESIDLAETIDAAAVLAIPELADWCVIDLVEPDGSLRRVAAVAGDPAAQSTLEGIRDFPTAPDSSRPAARAVRTRRPIIVEDLTDPVALRRATGGIDDLAAIVRAMQARSVIVQPLLARGQAIGAMFFVVGPDRIYTAVDVEVTSDLARRVALAISNAQVHAAEQEARRAAEAAADRLGRLQRLTRELAGEQTRNGVVDLVVREGRAAFGASGAVVAILGEENLSVVASDGYDEARVRAMVTIPISSRLPLATAARTAEPVWLVDLHAADHDGGVSQAIIAESPNQSACAVPLIADGITFGVIGLSFIESRPFDQVDRDHIGAYADLCAQALARVALTAIRERLLVDLESERARLEALLQQAPEGLMIAESPSGRILLANDQLEAILGFPRSELHQIAGGEKYQGFDEDGVELRPEDWPLARAVRGETVPYQEIELVRADGSRTWVAKRAGPVLDREGNVVAGVATIIDISAQRLARENRTLLSAATDILASSLDYEETIRQVAETIVPSAADWVAVDILDDKGVPRRVAVAHEDPAKVALAIELAERYPSDPNAPRGMPYVLRTGQRDADPNVTDELIEAAARDPEHLDVIRSLGIRSWLCVPIMAGEQVLGAISFVAGEPDRFGPERIAFAENLAARIALAMSTSRSYREAIRSKNVLDATLDAVIVFDPVTLRISYVNAGAMDQLGYTEPDLVGAEATTVIEDLDPIGLRGLVEPLVSGALDARTATLTFRHSDGRSVPVEALLQHVVPAGEAGRIVAVARDVGERMEAQANLRRLAESEHARAAELNAVIKAIGDGIFVCQPDGRISLANPAAEALFPDVEEETYEDILLQIDDPDGDAPALGTVGGPVELRARGADERWIEVSTYPVSRGDDKDGHDGPRAAPETIVMLRDVTQARKSQMIRDTFIGVLSHELRTPVTTIYAGSKVLARDHEQLPAETQREIFSDIVVESERLHRLVEDVIAMTRFGEDEGDVGTEPVLVQRILPAVIRSEKSRWPGVTFELDLLPGLPTAIADPTYVEQVVRNLLSNAAKYGGAGTTVRVAVTSTDEEVIVTVTDDGPGFPPEEADRVFDLFFRSQGTAAAAAGAGIGLFVCARLIRAMGGRIWAKPGESGGAEFGFTLRVMTDEA